MKHPQILDDELISEERKHLKRVLAEQLQTAAFACYVGAIILALMLMLWAMLWLGWIGTFWGSIALDALIVAFFLLTIYSGFKLYRLHKAL